MMITTPRGGEGINKVKEFIQKEKNIPKKRKKRKLDERERKSK